MTDTDDLPTTDEILTVHDRIERKYDLKYKGLMKSAPKPKLRREVIEPAREYEDPHHRAATLLFGIQSVHVFEDANKRTAWTVTMDYLKQRGIIPEFQQDEETIERINRRVGLFDVDELADWFETGSIDTDKLPEH